MTVEYRQFLGKSFTGIIHQKAQRIDMTMTRGIIWNRPERFIVNTPFGQAEIGYGDWMLKYPSGSYYVFKNEDLMHVCPREPQKKWWKIW